MIERLFPGLVSCAETRDDDPAPLFPEEMALIERAVPSRQREFATARLCARRALRALGCPDTPILRGAKSEPLWPAGIVGSITHCAGFRGAAVARAEDMLTIGIDAEPHAALPPGVQRYVLGHAERIWVGAGHAAARPGIHWDRLIFSAKESVYKAWYPVARTWLGFEDATVTVDPDAGTFTATLHKPAPKGLGPVLAGRFLVEDGLMLTAIAVPCSAAARQAAPFSAITGRS